jgi:GAF domain-containing protein
MGMRFPSHQGIAGWVVMTGEPIAVSDVRRDPRWAKDFARATGYVPQSIMAVPLLVGEEVEGVLEVLDKAAGASFGLDDMELLGLFARPAAIAVEQTRLVTDVARLLVEELGTLARTHDRPDLAVDIQRALSDDAGPTEATLELARLVHRLSRRGQRAQTLALEILSSVLKYG